MVVCWDGEHQHGRIAIFGFMMFHARFGLHSSATQKGKVNPCTTLLDYDFIHATAWRFLDTVRVSNRRPVKQPVQTSQHIYHNSQLPSILWWLWDSQTIAEVCGYKLFDQSLMMFALMIMRQTDSWLDLGVTNCTWTYQHCLFLAGCRSACWKKARNGNSAIAKPCLEYPGVGPRANWLGAFSPVCIASPHEPASHCNSLCHLQLFNKGLSRDSSDAVFLGAVVWPSEEWLLHRLFTDAKHMQTCLDSKKRRQPLEYLRVEGHVKLGWIIGLAANSCPKAKGLTCRLPKHGIEERGR